MIPIIVLVLLVGTAWFFRKSKMSSDISLFDEEPTNSISTTSTTKTKVVEGQIPWYRWWEKKGWWKENEFIILLGIIMFHVVIGTVSPDWWIENIGGNWKIWVLHATLIVFALMIPKGTSLFHHKLGRIGVPFVIAMMLLVLFWKPNYAKAEAEAKAKVQARQEYLKPKTVEVPAPSEENPLVRSEILPIREGGRFRIFPSGPIYIFTCRTCSPIESDKGQEWGAELKGKIATLEFQSRKEDSENGKPVPVKVTVIRD